MKRHLFYSISLLLFCAPALAESQWEHASLRDQLSCSRSSTKKHSFTCTGSECQHISSENNFNTNNCQHRCDRAFSTLFLPRPVGLNSAVFFDPFLYACQEELPCWTVNIGYRYNQTFRNEQIACCLFGSNRLNFSGSQAINKQPRDLLADNFGLPPDFEGHVRFKPSIKNNIVDFSIRHELGQWSECLNGAYWIVNASLAHSIWSLGACETSETTTNHTFSAFPPCTVAGINTASSVEAAGDIATAVSGDFLFGDMQSQWRFGRFDLHRKRHDTKLANIDLIVGYDFFRCPEYHFGGFFKLVSPTGTKPHAHRLFEAIIGNGHHWEFGGGIDAHYELWSCDDHCFTAHITGGITHLFKDTQWRTFDFERSINSSGILSRYLLLKEFDANGIYANRLINAVNFTTRRVKSSFDLQGDAALRIVYRQCGWAIGLGYNVYGRSKEDLSEPSSNCREFTQRRFGIKGVNGVCALGFNQETGLTGQTVALSSTSSQARIFNTASLPLEVDNPVELRDPETGTIFLSWQSPNDVGTPEEELIPALDSEINETPAPRFVNTDDIRFKGIPSQLTHKIFAHVDYAWDCIDASPYLGIGGEIEFPHTGDCSVCTPHQWGIWIRGGIHF